MGAAADQAVHPPLVVPAGQCSTTGDMHCCHSQLEDNKTRLNADFERHLEAEHPGRCTINARHRAVLHSPICISC